MKYTAESPRRPKEGLVLMLNKMKFQKHKEGSMGFIFYMVLNNVLVPKYTTQTAPKHESTNEDS